MAIAGLPDEVVVALRAQVGEFTSGMRTARVEFTKFAGQASMDTQKLAKDQASLSKVLTTGKQAQTIRILANEFGNLGQMGGTASRAAAGLLGTVHALDAGIGTMSGGIGFLVSAIALVVAGMVGWAQHAKTVREEQEKLGRANATVAEKWLAMEASGTKLEPVMRRLSVVMKDIAAAERVTRIAALNAELSNLQATIEKGGADSINAVRRKKVVALELFLMQQRGYASLDQAIDANTRKEQAGARSALEVISEAERVKQELYADAAAQQALFDASKRQRRQQEQAEILQYAQAGAAAIAAGTGQWVGAVIEGTARAGEAYKMLGEAVVKFATKAFGQALIQEAATYYAKAAAALISVVGAGAAPGYFAAGTFLAGAGGTVMAAGEAIKLAEGGIVTRPTFAMIGEAGPEAVVPLGRGGLGGTVTIGEIGMSFPGVTRESDLRGGRFAQTAARQLAGLLQDVRTRQGVRT